ncbi:MAG: hypothetical protein E7496_07115 [Ruminococcus sp.]|nr:hypothetical protein [Ruminococcus sp.]
MHYNQTHLLRLAKRYQNSKRSYLLVNPLQAKHLAVEPGEALHMMQTLGRKLYQKYPNAKLIIGFAETATAIALHSAMQFPEDVCFLHTTREKLDGDCLNFKEEHSHAVEQRLYLSETLPRTQEIILIDDEISTGKTIRNMVSQIREAFPAFQNAKFIAGSVINRVSEDNLKLLEADNIFCECLCQLDNLDYTSQVEKFQVSAPEELPFSEALPYQCIISRSRLPESRKLHTVREYRKHYQEFAETVYDEIRPIIQNHKNLLVLGTEECMYPALILGELLENQDYFIKCHATTRSPIGICQDASYPIQKGFALASFYDPSRKTYIYNTDQTADAVLIVTDSKNNTEQAMQNFSILFPDSDKILIKG